MFLKFKLSNFVSVLEEQEVSFTTYSYSKDIKHINNIACLVGANGSGKTNLLRGFLLFLVFSVKSYLPENRHLFNLIVPHFTTTNKPSTFFVEWEYEKRRYTYEVSIFKQTILYERLKGTSDKNSYKTIFVRNKNSFRSSDIKISKQDKVRLTDKATVLSFLYEYGYIKSYEPNMLQPFENILSNIVLGGVNLENPEMLFLNDIRERLKDMDLYKALKHELEAVDTGIKDIVFQRTMFQKLNNSTHEILEEKEMDALYSVHTANGVNYRLPILCESDGTKNYVGLFIRLYGVLRKGGILIADELEKSLHIDLVERILNLFMNPVINKNNAQIIFSTHNPWFLQYLTKSQIFIVEKDNDSSTEVTRLDDIEGIRNDENFFIKYVNGAYDGKPKIKDWGM
ncbi:MAG: AAA family ATPase [Alphaproteobacteria bacterium]|nr:AAA family ATPase [Alphaproteobacteria bacterium]